MRKGIQKIIARLESFDISDEGFREYMQNTDLTLRQAAYISDYIINCKSVDTPTDMILNEIKKYDHEHNYMINLHSWLGSGDPLIGNDKYKKQLLEMFKSSPRNAMARLEINIFDFDKEYKDILIKAADRYIDAKEWDERYPDYGTGTFFYTISRLAYAKENHKDDPRMLYLRGSRKINNAIWNDFLENKEHSFLYAVLEKGKGISCDGCSLSAANVFLESTNEDKTFKDHAFKYFVLFPKNRPDYYKIDFEKIQKKLEGTLAQKTVLQMNKEGVIKNTENINARDYSTSWYDKDKVDAVKAALPDTSVKILSPFLYAVYRLRYGGAIDVKYTLCPETFIKGPETYSVNPVCGSGPSRRLSFFMYPDGNAYCKTQDEKRNIPLPMNKLLPFIQYEAVRRFFEQISENSGNMFIKDVIREMDDWGREYGYNSRYISPITFNDCIKYHNKQEYFLASYKKAGMIRYNYNHHPVVLSYMVIKALDKVDIRDYGILQNAGNDMMQRFIIPGKEKMTQFLAGFYLNRGKYDNDYIIKVQDYIDMCLEDRVPVVLHYSEKRLAEEHDHFMDHAVYKSYLTRVKPFKVPKDSKFNKVRKLLPDSFEWIKNRKRLITESMNMHHCVWGYYNKIADDRCAIYHFYDTEGKYDADGNSNPKDYTIEIIQRKGKYIINQVQTKYDRGGGHKLRKYMEGLLA